MLYAPAQQLLKSIAAPFRGAVWPSLSGISSGAGIDPDRYEGEVNQVIQAHRVQRSHAHLIQLPIGIPI